MQRLEINIPRDAWWSANNRFHWANVARRKKQVRTLSRVLAGLKLKPVKTCDLTAIVSIPTGARFDPHNVGSTVIKAAIDGLVDAGILLDDDKDHLTSVRVVAGEKTGRTGWYRLVLELEGKEND